MEPLASQIRPKKLDEFVGQEHLTGAGKPLRAAIEKRELFSFILWGPPGSGKSTIARSWRGDGERGEPHILSADDFFVDPETREVQERVGLAVVASGDHPSKPLIVGLVLTMGIAAAANAPANQATLPALVDQFFDRHAFASLRAEVPA